MTQNEVTRFTVQVTRRLVADRVALIPNAGGITYDEGIVACTAGERLRRSDGIGGIGGPSRLW